MTRSLRLCPCAEWAAPKKAIVIVSDGNDTSSRTNVRELKHLIRETEVLAAIGIDGQGKS
jgi:hypothetical protein